MRLGLWAMLLGVGLSTGSAGAEETVILVIRSRGLAAGKLSSLSSMLQTQLNQAQGMTARIPSEPLDPKSLRSGFVQARSLLQQAQAHYRSFEHHQALLQLEASQQALLRRCGGADLTLLRSQHFLEGLVHFMLGNREAAQAAFGQLAAIDPDWEPDPKEVAPKIVAVFNDAKKKRLGKARALLEVDGWPPGAQVWLNGRPVGSLPAVLDAVLPGVHCLEVKALGHASWVYRMTVPQGKTLRLRADLFPDRALPFLSTQPGMPKDQDPGELSRLFGADYLAWVDASENEATLFLSSAASQRVSGPITCLIAQIGTNQISGLVACLYRGILAARHELVSASAHLVSDAELQPKRSVAGLSHPDSASATPVDTLDSGEPAWYQRWWVWTLVVGAVAVGTGVGIGMVSSGQDQAGFRVVITRSSTR